MKSNPKTHDGLFKWLVTSFTEEFFAHYFPHITIGKYRFIDKEFISKYEALKESIKGDLFVIMEVEIENRFHEIIIQVEHKGERVNPGEQAYEYACYAWLLKKKPVWTIVIFTDDAVWRKPVQDSYCIGFDASNGCQFYHYDVIKIKAEKSADLITKHSLVCKLLSLKANDKGVDREDLIRAIYQAVSEMKPGLTNEQMLLVSQWVDAYGKIAKQKIQKIKKEANMEAVETTIGEHFMNMGMEKWMAKGMEQGMIEGKIRMIEDLYLKGMLTRQFFDEMTAGLKKELDALQDS